MITETVLCAAYHFHDGKQHPHQPKNITTGFVVAGRMHHNIINTVVILSGLPMHHIGNGDHDDGFLTSTNRFVGREEAARIALSAGQIAKPKPELYSEDLY